ncbi:hypothetical protein FB45DRAFT_1034391 [Roridomyces roridus]|uniref:Uncharacterized protein n=1 Tax=Roridomyces roridus TaxID=1738132 RepID=A0AAD7BC65_9AGAR|nr:hypothetical protein FB45DRAFT_1034391 [Roridomyces roridus]
MCSSSSDGSTIQACINLFPESWCTRLQDTSADEAQMAERNREADLFHTSSDQPQATVAMDDKRAAAIRDKSLILSDE